MERSGLPQNWQECEGYGFFRAFEGLFPPRSLFNSQNLQEIMGNAAVLAV
jgi:hypothetical protein